MITIVDNFRYRGRNFTICHDETHYMAVEDKYLDKNRKTICDLYGYQVFSSTTFQGCLSYAKQSVDIDCEIKRGATKAEAFKKVLGLPDCVDLDALEKVLA